MNKYTEHKIRASKVVGFIVVPVPEYNDPETVRFIRFPINGIVSWTNGQIVVDKNNNWICPLDQTGEEISRILFDVRIKFHRYLNGE